MINLGPRWNVIYQIYGVFSKYYRVSLEKCHIDFGRDERYAWNLLIFALHSVRLNGIYLLFITNL